MSLLPYTLIIPAFNARDWIDEAIRSAVEQNPSPSRILVIDDGSTDGTAAFVRENHGEALVVTQNNAGPGAATTRGLHMVDTPVVAMLDADDVWLPGKMEAQLRVLAQPDVSGVFTMIEDFRGEPSIERTGHSYEGWGRSTLVFRTEAARSLGPILDPPSRIGEMIEWIAAARAKGHRLVMVPQVLALRRAHSRNSTRRDRAELGNAYMQIVLKSLRTRKEAGT